MATHSNILAWKIPWTEKPGRLQSMGLQRVGHDRVTSHILHWNEKGRLLGPAGWKGRPCSDWLRGRSVKAQSCQVGLCMWVFGDMWLSVMSLV